MNNSNIKVYLAVSGALIVLLILIIIIPFTKKSTTQNNPTDLTSQPFPTTVETNPSTGSNQVDKYISPGFTGVAEEELPTQTIEVATQKKDLRQKSPLNLSTFSIDFDYSQDKFTVTFKDPKDTAQKEFESWRISNYPALGTDQFLLK